MTYQERCALAAEVSRLAGGYQARVSETDPFITIKGGTMTGWAKFTPEEVRERFGLPAPTPGAA